jgi:hypothetical protein
MACYREITKRKMAQLKPNFGLGQSVEEAFKGAVPKNVVQIGNFAKRGDERIPPPPPLVR